jgi:hypothetical protein
VSGPAAAPTPTGYFHPAYASSLRHVGEPLPLPASGGWVLRRAIAAGPFHDCTGPYPLFVCRDWRGLADDFAELRGSGLISVTLVPDPFGRYSGADLDSLFDVVRAVKTRWIADLRTDFHAGVSSHHRRHVDRALAAVRVERCADPLQYATEWSACYLSFVQRQGVTGPAAFPPAALAAHLSIPGLVMYRASRDEQTLGFSLWMTQDSCAYGHLAAYTDEGREAGASYACQWTMLQDLQRQGVERVDLGAGVSDGDGLARWKAGWTPHSQASLLCGAILRPAEYHQLAQGMAHHSFFPPYRERP